MQDAVKAQCAIEMVGDDSGMLSASEVKAGIEAAWAVFNRYEVDPLDCAKADKKRESGELLNSDEALRCVIWDTADEAAWRAATVGWLSRDILIGIAVN